MKIALLIVDRDEGYAFTNVEKAPKDATVCEVVLDPGVNQNDVWDREKTLWVVHEKTGQIRVRFVLGSKVLWSKPLTSPWFPIPTPTVLEDETDYDEI